VRVREEFDLSRLRSIGSTASPLPPEVFRWVYRHLANDVLLGSISGGTDVCTSLVMSCPLLPVHAGELQCRALGAEVQAFDRAGHALIGEVGELVVTKPMPSMPLFFWGDQGFAEYKHAYFDVFPGVWRHGDWITISQRGTCVISGRSDATLNRGGVRMGTSEFYRVVEALPFVDDSLAVEVGAPQSRLLLFVVVGPGEQGSDVTTRLIRETIRRELSPRHVPDAIYEITEVPRTLNGKKLEVPVKRILSGVAPDAAVSRGAVANPESLDFFARLAGIISAGS
jgi:acetoacetyl-CoA synthetase